MSLIFSGDDKPKVPNTVEEILAKAATTPPGIQDQALIDKGKTLVQSPDRVEVKELSPLMKESIEKGNKLDAPSESKSARPS